MTAGDDTFDPGAMLESLRWDVDYMVWNHFEYVWLKADIDENGNRRGITDCCLAEAPCTRHAAIAAERVREAMSEKINAEPVTMPDGRRAVQIHGDGEESVLVMSPRREPRSPIAESSWRSTMSSDGSAVWVHDRLGIFVASTLFTPPREQAQAHVVVSKTEDGRFVKPSEADMRRVRADFDMDAAEEFSPSPALGRHLFLPL